MESVICTRCLSKKFEMAEVVSSVDMSVRRGEIYGFIGSNGAGKSTIMKMLLGLVKPTDGEIELFGKRLLFNSTEHLKRIGHLIETPIFYERLTAAQNLEIHGEYMGYYNTNSIYEALELVQLFDVEDKPVKQFSLGMKQRLGIARAIFTKPELLLLDEPVNGLDPEGIQVMRNLFRRLRDEWGISLLISSHLLSEVEQIVDTIGVINDGQLIQEVSMKEVRASKTEYVEIVTSNISLAAFVLEEKLNLKNFKQISDHAFRVYDSDISEETLSKELILNDVPIKTINRHHQSLEEYFFDMVKGDRNHDASY